MENEDVIFPTKTEINRIERVKETEEGEAIREIQIVQRTTDTPTTDFLTRLARILKDNPDLVTQIFIILFIFFLGYFVGSSSLSDLFTKAGLINLLYTSIWGILASSALFLRLCVLSGKINIAVQKKVNKALDRVTTRIKKPCKENGQSFVSDGYEAR